MSAYRTPGSTYHDISGQEIRVGSLICYAGLWSRSATLRFGRVTALKTREPGYGKFDLLSTLRLVAIDRNYDGVWHVLNNGKPITLGFLDRLMVVPETMVPPQALALLATP